MERRDVVLAHWLEFQNGDDANAHIRSFERAWDFSARWARTFTNPPQN